MHEEAAVLEVFNNYNLDFRKLDAKILVDYYYYPSILTDNEQTILMFHPLVAHFVFGSVVKKFEMQKYGYTILNTITAKQLSENLALVSGRATRHREDDTPYEEFGFTYTFRKKADKWKIVYGVIHDKETYLTLPQS
jgi:ketosteroid isomerase-like protein